MVIYSGSCSIRLTDESSWCCCVPGELIGVRLNYISLVDEDRGEEDCGGVADRGEEGMG